MNQKQQKILGLCGWSGSGKTHLIQQLIPELISKGLKVSSMKRTHHNVNLDTNEKKDSCKHRAAGSSEVLLASTSRYAITHELVDEPEPSPEELAMQLKPVDIVIAEGFKAFSHRKVEVYRTAVCEKPPMCTVAGGSVKNIVAIATDEVAKVREMLREAGVAEGTDTYAELPVLYMNNVQEVAEFVINITI